MKNLTKENKKKKGSHKILLLVNQMWHHHEEIKMRMEIIMEKNIRQLIKEINDGKNLEMNLPKYVECLTNDYYEMSLLHVTMNYYMLYESVTGDLMKKLKPTLDCIQQIIKVAFIDSLNQEAIETSIKQLDKQRDINIKKMKVLTAYTDKMRVYEYVLNRMEKRFETDVRIEQQQEMDLKQKIVSYIFETKDNQIINERIRQVIGQLPVRMTRKYYLELVKDSLSIYKGSDKSSVDTYVYMIKNSAMIYEPEGQEEYFVEYKEQIDAFGKVDYNTLDNMQYNLLVEGLQQNAISMELESDMYVSLQELMNHLYAYLLMMLYETSKEEEQILICKEVVGAVYELFESGMSETIPEEVEKKLFVTEGKQESAYTRMQLLESILEEVCINQKDFCEHILLGKRTQALMYANQLMSPSLFIELDEEEQKGLADEAYITSVTEELIGLLTEQFKENQICVNRAVIANTIDKMPVFFQSMEEVSSYIETTLSQCHDIGEKLISMELLENIIEESKG